MITYVNTVLVSNSTAGAADNVLTSMPTTVANITAAAGKFIFMNCDDNVAANSIYSVTVSNAADINRIKIGMFTGKYNTIVDNGTTTYVPVVKWSNIINKKDIKSLKFTGNTDHTASEDVVNIDFSTIDASVLSFLAQGGKRVIVRLTFKDLPTRFRKWTESYEYVTAPGDTAVTIAAALMNTINKQVKRARVVATVAAGSSDTDSNTSKLVLTAMPYDDDDSVDTINVANKVRFNANLYYTDPSAAAFASNNKYFVTGVTITKTAGIDNPVAAKHVRDREAQAMGYEGILNRGEGTWPIIKPAMNTDLSAQYDGITLEFENMYRAADDIFRKTKQTVEIYGITTKLGTASATTASVMGILNKFIA